MARPESVKVLKAAMDEDEQILRGIIAPESLDLLQVDDSYQREVLPLAKIADLTAAIEKGSVPDIVLGMRGTAVTARDGVYYLHDPVFIIDGLQRVTAAKRLLAKDSAKSPRIGAMIHFNTTKVWERLRFRILNVERTKLSTNVVLRNDRADVPVLDTLYRLCTDRGFVLADRVCWQQRMTRDHLITAVSFVKVVGALHSRFGVSQSFGIDQLVRRLQSVHDKYGQGLVRENTRLFFEVIDSCWGVRRITFREGAAYMYLNFLTSLATIFTKFDEFWKNNGLSVERDIRRKLQTFPLDDPYVAKLAAGGNPARPLLYRYLLDHINSGKRTRRLVDPAIIVDGEPAARSADQDRDNTPPPAEAGT